MLQDARSSLGSKYGLKSEDQSENEAIDLDRILSAARRQWRLVVFASIVSGILGLAYVLTAVPLYTASADLLIDQGSNRIVDALSSSAGSLEDDGAILSQVELLKSEQIGLIVINNLKLLDDPAFMAGSSSLMGRVKSALMSVVNLASWFVSEDAAASDQDGLRQDALQSLSDNVDVTRVGRSYVLTISYTFSDAAKAANIAQAFADAYLSDQLDSRYESTRRASGWLQQRIDELRQKSLQTDLAVQKFRSENGLIAADGRLVSDQQLSELNSQLTTAQADLATSQARYDRIKALIDSGDTNAVVNDALASETISTMRAKFLDASKRETDIRTRLGADHIQAVRLRAEMAEYQRLMFQELGRIADSYQSDLQVAKARADSVRANVEAATGVSAGANDAQVQLRELEREAETYRNLYQTFLQRYQEAVQQQSFPVTEARVISRAQPPSVPSRPRKPLVLAIAVVFGAAAGTCLGAFREYRDRFFRTGDQVRDELGLEFIGLIPLVKSSAIGKIAPTGPEQDRVISRKTSVTRYVLDNPLSSFAETLRSAKVAADLTIEQRQPKIIGIVSVLPGEGKSTMSINFAELLASQGAKTLLIDGDLRNPGLTRSIASHAVAGIVEGVLDQRPLRDLIMIDPETKLSFLPAVVHRRIPHTAELLSSQGMANIFAEAGDMFDYILVDLPPLAPVVDVRAIAPRIDGFIFVVEWGRTARRMVQSTLAANPQVAEKCFGVVLNRVDSEKMKLYRDFGSNEYYQSRYSSYYKEA